MSDYNYETIKASVMQWYEKVFELKYDGGYMHGDIEIKLEDDMIKVIISGNVNCSFKAEYAFIQKITPYKN